MHKQEEDTVQPKHYVLCGRYSELATMTKTEASTISTELSQRKSLTGSAELLFTQCRRSPLKLLDSCGIWYCISCVMNANPSVKRRD